MFFRVSSTSPRFSPRKTTNGGALEGHLERLALGEPRPRVVDDRYPRVEIADVDTTRIGHRRTLLPLVLAQSLRSNEAERGEGHDGYRFTALRGESGT